MYLMSSMVYTLIMTILRIELRGGAWGRPPPPPPSERNPEIYYFIPWVGQNGEILPSLSCDNICVLHVLIT